jgi:hypothetical protein
MIFRAKIYVCNHMEPERLLYYWKTPKWYQNEQRLFMTNILIPLEQAIFPRRRAPHQKWLVVHLNKCSVDTYQASIDWLEQHSMTPCHIHPIRMIWPQWFLLVSYSGKTRRNSCGWRRPVFERLQEILKRTDQEKLNDVFQACMRRV